MNTSTETQNLTVQDRFMLAAKSVAAEGISITINREYAVWAGLTLGGDAAITELRPFIDFDHKGSPVVARDHRSEGLSAGEPVSQVSIGRSPVTGDFVPVTDILAEKFREQGFQVGKTDAYDDGILVHL